MSERGRDRKGVWEEVLDDIEDEYWYGNRNWDEINGDDNDEGVEEELKMVKRR